MSDLECDHCGGIAFTSTNYDPAGAEGQGCYLFADGDGEACAACGFPGQVVVDDQANGEPIDVRWSCSEGNEDMCNDPLCGSCDEARLHFGKITKARYWAIAAVRDIVEDIEDRRGLKWEWAGIDKEIRWGIAEAWIEIVNGRMLPLASDGSKENPK